MSGELATTNLILGIMAAISVLEGLVIIGMGIAGFVVYRRMARLVDTWMALAQGVEARQMAPAMMRVNAILDDVKTVTARVRDETERVDEAIHSTIDRIDETAFRVRSNVRAKTGALVALVHAARTALEGMLRSEART
jgi:F420-0:gamma-glutamyl ligase-like protein